MIPESNEFINNAFENQPLEAIKSVYAFQSLVGQLDNAYLEFFDKYLKFRNKYLGGPKQRPDRHERCTKLVSQQFGMELDFELIEILFPKFSQEKAVVKVAELVRSSILKGLKRIRS